MSALLCVTRRLKKKTQKNKKNQMYIRELSEISHLDFRHSSQDLHQVEAVVCLEPTDDDDEEEECRAGREEGIRN